MTSPHSLQLAHARDIAERALSEHRVAESTSLSLTEALHALMEHATAAQQTRNGRELALFEADPARVGRMIDLLVVGGYRERAAQAAGIAPSSVRNWLKQAAAGDGRYQAVAAVIEVAEAIAEGRQIATIAKHSRKEWTAAAWLLERKYPERWGKRPEETSGPQVVVQIGCRDSDVQILMAAPKPEGNEENEESLAGC